MKLQVLTGYNLRQATLISCVALSACTEEPPRSPFELWTIRPGDSFKSINDRARQVGGSEFRCRRLVHPYRHCELRSTGMPMTGVAGTLHVIVDSTDSAILVQFARSEQYAAPAIRARLDQEWKDEVGTLATTWATPDVSSGTEQSTGLRTERWLTRDSAFSASVIYSATGDTARAISLTDEPRFAALRASSPFADWVLDAAVIVPGLDREAISMKVIAATTNQAAPSANVGPSSAPTVAECELELADLVLPPSAAGFDQRDARQELGAQAARMLESAVPVAYPGWKVQFGQHVYLVSPNGAAEQVHIRVAHDRESPGIRDEDAVFAFSIHRIRRLDSARRRLSDATQTTLCRAPAEVVFVRARDGVVAESVVIPLDNEAIIVDVGEMQFTTIDPTRATLIVEHTGTYRTADWTGRVTWRANMPTDPPRIGSRNLVAFERVGIPTNADTVVGMVVNARAAGDTLFFDTIEEHLGRPSTQHVRMPLGAGRSLRASDLLNRIQ